MCERVQWWWYTVPILEIPILLSRVQSQGPTNFPIDWPQQHRDWSSTPGSQKRPPGEEDIWSKSSVFEFRRGLILFAGFVAVGRMEDTRLPKSVMFGELVEGVGCVGDQEKEGMGRLLDDLRSFGINADLWTAAAQNEGG